MWKELYFWPATGLAGEALGDSIVVLQDEKTGEVAFAIHQHVGTPDAKGATVVLPPEYAAALAVAVSTGTFPWLPTNRS